MYTQLSSWDFRDAFVNAGRGDQFSPEALDALYAFYDEIGDIELDVIAICCDWTEYDGDDIITDYGYMVDRDDYDVYDDDDDNDNDYIEGIINELQNHTTVIECGTWLVEAF